MQLTDEDRALARSIYSTFSRLPGSEHIATEFALVHLSALLSELRPSRVLEIGAGIGTITRLILDHPSEVDLLVSTEENEFCRQALAKNIGDTHAGRWRLISSPNEERAGAYDLVIFDGYTGVEDVYPRLTEGTVCFVEGIRQPIREGLNEFLFTRGLECAFTSYIRPRSLRLSRNRKWLGFLPKIKFRTNKGCHIGRIKCLSQ